MEMLSRLLLFIGSLVLLDQAGNAFLLTLISTSQQQIPSIISTAIFFMIGATALFAAFRTQWLSSPWFAVAGVVGLVNVAITELVTSCRNVMANDLSHRAYYCSNSEMRWLVIVICLAFLAVYAKRRRNLVGSK